MVLATTTLVGTTRKITARTKDSTSEPRRGGTGHSKKNSGKDDILVLLAAADKEQRAPAVWT